MKPENHKRCDTMGFWKDGTDKLETRFRLLISKIFSRGGRRTFQSVVSHLVLLKRARCMRKKHVSVRPRNPTDRIRSVIV